MYYYTFKSIETTLFLKPNEGRTSERSSGASGAQDRARDLQAVGHFLGGEHQLVRDHAAHRLAPARALLLQEPPQARLAGGVDGEHVSHRVGQRVVAVGQAVRQRKEGEVGVGERAYWRVVHGVSKCYGEALGVKSLA